MRLVPLRLRRVGDRTPTGLERWRRRSRVVGRLRRGTPFAIGLLALVVIGWVGVRAIISALAPNRLGDDIHMNRPKFYGRDDHGKPFVIGGSSAVRDQKNPDVIYLTDPDMTLDAGAPQLTHVVGRRGVFNEASRLLDLRGHVVLDDGRGYHFVSEHAVVNTQTDDVDGDSFVQGDGPIGHIDAKSYAIRDRGVRLFFAGDVHTHLSNGH